MQAGIIKMIYWEKHNWGVGSCGLADLCFLSQAPLYFLIITTLFTHVHDFLSVRAIFIFKHGFKKMMCLGGGSKANCHDFIKALPYEKRFYLAYIMHSENLNCSATHGNEDRPFICQ